jgi:hypothetical protein
MTSANKGYGCPPLIQLQDRLVRKPIAPWRASLVRQLGEAIGSPDIAFDHIAPLLNQLALLEAYQGNTARALEACAAQIRFWQRLARSPGNEHRLGNVVQPWINIVRLERWNQKLDSSIALYRELAPARRSTLATLQRRYGIALTFDELVQLDPQADVRAVLDVVYWREYGHLLLNAGANDALERHLEAGLGQVAGALLVFLFETLLAYQASRGHHASALALLHRNRLAQRGLYRLPFAALAMFLAWRAESSEFAGLAETVFDAAVSGEHNERDGRGMLLLVDIARLFEWFGLQRQELELLQLACDIALEVDDEVLQFEVMRRLATLDPNRTGDLRQRFGASSYALIRKHLGLGPQAPGAGPDVVQALQYLAELDFASCLSILHGEGVPAARVHAA